MTLKIYPTFATPMGEFSVPSAEALNSELHALILRLEAEGDANRNTDAVVSQPPGLYEGKFDFFSRDEPCIQRLRESCWGALGEMIQQLNDSLANDTKGLRIASQTWFHVTRNGGYFGYHNHPMASWSGVYCVSRGVPTPGITNNGCLVFPHPMVAVNSYLDVANSTLRWPYKPGNLSLSLAPGQLILFPSWLGHMVTPFVGRGERITVAFNAWFSRD